MERREHRLKHAVKMKDTSTQWDLIAAAVEEAVVKLFKLEGKEAKKMRGRSKITFNEKTKMLLKGMEEDEENADIVSRATWFRAAAGCRTKLANKLINVARYMKTKTGDEQKAIEIQTLSIKTFAAYKELVAKLSKKEELAQSQKDQIKESWMTKRTKQKGKEKRTKVQEQSGCGRKIEEVQKFGGEAKAALEQIEACNINNVIHAAKIARYGEAHKQMAQSYMAKAKGEVENNTKERNSSNKDGGKHLAATIGEQTGKPLTHVCRGRDKNDGGNKGQIASNPADIDAVVRRAWQAIHKCAGGCITTAVDLFVDMYCNTIYKRKPDEVGKITAEMVQESFSRTKESAGALDGWSPKELSMLALSAYGHIATRLDQVEE